MRDRALVRRVLSGDRQAGERLVSEHYSGIYRLLRGLTLRADAAEDLTQQTFVRAWQALASYRGEASLSTWLHKIAYREYSHWARDRKPMASLDERPCASDDVAMEAVDVLIFRKALEELTCEHRETFVLYHIQRMSIGEVSKLTGAPEGTVKSRLFFARRHLRDLLAEAWPASEARREHRTTRPSDLAEEGTNL